LKTSCKQTYFILSLRSHMPPKLSFDNYYTLFGVQANFTPKQLKTGYQNLVRIYHPDKNIKEDTTEAFQQIKDAYEVLKDDNLKAVYDREIQAKLQRQQRKQKMDNKRSRMTDDLLEKERIHKRRKMDEQQKKYSREAEKSQRRNMTQEARNVYEENKIQKHAQDLKIQQRKESLNYVDDFIVLKWDSEKGNYTKEDIIGIFGTFGSIGAVSFVDDQIALLVFRQENGAIKLMCSVQEGKKFGLPSNRIVVKWVDQQSETSHFQQAKTKTAKNVQKEKTFNKLEYPTLEEHLALEKQVLGMLEEASTK